MAGRTQLLVPLLLAAMLGACATAPIMRGIDQPAPPQATADPAVVSLRAKLAEGARSIIGAKQLVVRGRRFTMDCTGVVLAIYWYAGVDLARDFKRFTGNGVGRIYKTLEREDLLYSTSTPLVGDIIFWDNTYDENQDNGWNDPLSHVGMVLRVDDDGTITYVHHHVRRGISTDYMNLRSPAVQSQVENGRVKLINSPLRLAVAGRPHPPNWLSGQLYRSLGMGYLLE
jgi:hypothetical protein